MTSVKMRHHRKISGLLDFPCFPWIPSVFQERLQVILVEPNGKLTRTRDLLHLLDIHCFYGCIWGYLMAAASAADPQSGIPVFSPWPLDLLVLLPGGLHEP